MPPSARKRRPPGAKRLENTTPELPMTPPGGMRDLLPPASMTRTLLWQRLMETFDRHGYQRVTTPPVEYAEVIERGLGTVDRRDLVRFIEPDSGEVALLRPDVTPQIARIVATRLQDRPAPWRLCYEGTIVRRRRGRARKQRQVLQCGIECVGVKGPEADAEVIEVAVRACEGVGLQDFLVELAQVKIGTEVLDHVPEDARLAVIDTLAAKDATNLEKLLKEAGVVAAERKRLITLCDLYGDRSVIADARRRLRNAAAKRALDELERVVARLESAGLGDRVAIDLSDLRRHSYYTGVSMTLLVTTTCSAGTTLRHRRPVSPSRSTTSFGRSPMLGSRSAASCHFESSSQEAATPGAARRRRLGGSATHALRCWRPRAKTKPDSTPRRGIMIC
ncbi:MAG: ATP phosphoribosyltransferase regulatory subunit [Deltaproteobacteria bacterium]|nr:ATP phosphoribosyltransferase regulatory subunit [Deltaproteobacteria bacterium]